MNIKSSYAYDCFDFLKKAKRSYTHVKDQKLSDKKGASTISVFTEKNRVDELLVVERGHWDLDGEKIAFTNKTQYVLKDESIYISHLRYNKDAPIFLLELFEKTPGLLETKTPHVCGQDCYIAKMKLEGDSLFIGWKIVGPSKDQEICMHVVCE